MAGKSPRTMPPPGQTPRRRQESSNGWDARTRLCSFASAPTGANGRGALRFLVECLPSRARENTRHLVALATYSRTKLGELRRETGIQYDQLQRGILHFYTDESEFERAASQNAGKMQMKTAEECIALEPALRHAADNIVGGIVLPRR